MEPVINILLVDDEARNLDALEVILADPGYRLLRAQSGDEALRVLLKEDVAAIVLDIRMPDLTGFELAQIIKGRRRFSEVPILFLTAYLLEDHDVIAGYGAGAVDYLTKPVNPVVLRHKIAVFADLFRKTRALAELNETLETRVQERTAELAKSEAALRLADRQKDEFLATLAHELRNPLAPLRMGLDLLLRTGSTETRGTLSIMNRQLAHMVRLIDDLLDVARISGGKLELKMERVNVADAIQTALDTSRPFFAQRRQLVAADLDSSLFSFADPTRLTQIVGNLLHNASKFTPEQGRVRLELTRQNGLAVIRVIDSGIGIADEQLPRVFEMFTRIERPTLGPDGGLGIGLALSRRLAEMQGGALSVASPGVGKGSIFTFSLPTETVTAPAARAAPALETVAEPVSADPKPGVSVLIIEDNRDSAEVLGLWMQGRGYAPTIAHTGPDGLALLEKTRPTIVVCDIGLPEMSGIEVCRRVRALELGYRPVMIALTGWGREDDLQRTRDSGFDHHLVKPVEPEKLFTLLDGARDTSSAR